jgi:transposase
MKAVTMYDMGLKPREIQARTGLSRDAIHGVVRRYRSQASARSKPRSGRPPALTGSDNSHILRTVDKEPFIHLRDLIEKAGLTCHKHTVTRLLKRQGIQHHQSLRQPFLGPQAVAACQAFAAKYRHEPDSFWHS